MSFLIISVTRGQKHSLVMGFRVSKCGFRIPNFKERTRRDSIRMLYPKRTKNGRIWVRIFADIPITRKPTEVRMGKGKGNPTGWMARVVTG
ncbi:hypothetical protein KP509_35G023300 [Ceratopteris richardii]|uniref:Large ribosomal subunit protein uL16m n=1 Tax=Ceratopteris richardii TaxID=49495 RepID=A0A8T2QFT8_CERRI|nr:hypothetical protein KP509_35G023300 [Ceratopteris richardii]